MIDLKKYEFIGFDLDGTLVNSSNAIMSCLEKTLPKYINQKNINFNDLMTQLYPLTINQYPDYIDFNSDQCFDDFKQEFSKKFDNKYFKKVKLLPYTIDILKASVRYFCKDNIFILTNRRIESASQLCKHLGISEIINDNKITSTVDDGTDNPKIKSLKDLIIKYNFIDKFGCYIGDSDSDIESALKNNLHAIKLHDCQGENFTKQHYEKYDNISYINLRKYMELLIDVK